MVYCVLFTIELENDAEVQRFLTGFHTLQRFVKLNEPGTLTYELHQAVGDEEKGEPRFNSRRFTVLERYASERDFKEVHFKSKTFGEFFALVQTLKVVGAPALEQFSDEIAAPALRAAGAGKRGAAALESPLPLVAKGVLLLAGSREGAKPSYMKEAARLGELIIKKMQLPLVYGGGTIGLMGAAAKAAVQAGKEVGGGWQQGVPKVVAIIPQAMFPREVSGEMVGDMIYTPATMHQRKEMMITHATHVIALPGGLGTFDELFEYLTLFQVNATQAKIGLLNVDGFFDSFLQHLQHLVREGFVGGDVTGYFVVKNTAEDLVEALKAFQAPEPASRLEWHL